MILHVSSILSEPRVEFDQRHNFSSVPIRPLDLEIEALAQSKELMLGEVVSGIYISGERLEARIYMEFGRTSGRN